MENTKTPLRVALYVRVSAQEQAIRGLSLEAQQEDLQDYCRSQGWLVMGVYIDAAKTARKSLGKRTNFLRMIEDVKRDKVDMILFTRLDRWFRSVADYYKVMEVLEAHHCGWKTTQEQYDTSTAGGRLYINMKLSIAQNEADLCGERIAVVFDSKIRHGTVISGSVPFGYRVNEQKRMEIIPEQAEIVRDAFERYASTISLNGTIRYIREKYGVNWCEATFKRMLHERLYLGYYQRRGRINEQFCPPILSRELFDGVQKMMPHNAKSGPSGRIYLFTTLLICEECKHKMASVYNTTTYYRCNQHYRRSLCSHNKGVREEALEKWLLQNLQHCLDKEREAWEAKEAQQKQSSAIVERKAIQRKLSRLKELYLNEAIQMDEYKRDYATLTERLSAIPVPPPLERPNFEAVEELIKKDFAKEYGKLSREEKRTLWRSMIKEIYLNNENEITNLIFL